jgi:hypothetical protein
MIKIRTKNELNKLPPQPGYVLIESLGKVFTNHEGEWIEKSYFTIRECAEELNLQEWEVRLFVNMLDMATTNGRNHRALKLNLSMLKALVATKKLRAQDYSFEQIRKRIWKKPTPSKNSA